MNRFARSRRAVFAVALVLMALAAFQPLVAQQKPVEITWWNYPNFTTLDGELGKYEKQMIAAFNQKYPNIKVNVEMISFNGGPEKVNVAIASNSAPTSSSTTPAASPTMPARASWSASTACSPRPSSRT